MLMGQVERTFEQMGQIMTTTTDFTVSEPSVANRLGVSVAVVRQLRGTEGVDWALAKNRRRLWSEDAVAKAAVTLRQGAAPESPTSTWPDEKPPPHDIPAEHGIERLTVAKSGFYNTRILHATVPGEDYDPGLPRVVHVKDNRRFAPGMEILARRVRERAPVYDFEGNPANPAAGRRLPRRLGKW